MWKIVAGIVGALVAAAAVETWVELSAAEAERRRERRDKRREKRWDQQQKDAARRAQVAEEAEPKEKERLRLQKEGDDRKEAELVQKWAPTVLYWEGWLGRGQLFRFKPAALPEGEHFDGTLEEVEDLGLQVRDASSGSQRFIPFEGMNVALVKDEDDDEDEDAEDDENEAA